jgi:hypothetical protein
MFFFEKKNQKTFATWRTLPDGPATAVQKFFASFFQKRSAYPFMAFTIVLPNADGLSAT